MDSFDKLAKSYDANAVVQRVFAKKLVHMVQQRQPCRVLDLGCGTGFVAEALFEHGVAFDYFLGVDKSPGMVEVSRSKFPFLHFDVLDFRDILPRLFEFDTLISNFALQWLEDPVNFVLSVMKELRLGAVFYFSIPVNGTFNEIIESSRLYNVRPIQIMQFMSYDEIRHSMGGFLQHSSQESVTQNFSNPLLAMMSIKKIGASYAKSGKYSYKEMKNLFFAYNRLFFVGEGVELTYKVGLFALQKIGV